MATPIDKNRRIHHFLKKVEQSKNILAEERDKLRKMYEEIEALVNSMDSRIEEIEEGLRIIEGAIDGISKTV